MTRAVIFDVDGTLVDTVDLHATVWVETLARFGVQADFHEVRSQIGKGGDQLLPVFAPESLVEAQGDAIKTDASAMYQTEYMPRAKPFPGVRALFDRLHADGKRVALGSSGKAAEIEHYIGLLGIEGVADVVTTSEDAEHSKPFPDIFLAAFEKLQPVDRTEVVVVGDSPFDAQAAIGAGLTPVAVLSGGFPENDLRAAGFVEVHADPAGLLADYDGSILGRRT